MATSPSVLPEGVNQSPHTCTLQCPLPHLGPVRGRRGVSGRCRRVPAPLPGGHRAGVQQRPERPCLSLAPVVDVSVLHPVGDWSRLRPWGASAGYVAVRWRLGVVQGVAATRVDPEAAEEARGVTAFPARCLSTSSLRRSGTSFARSPWGRCLTAFPLPFQEGAAELGG